jgi:surface carbohydrate biosynthesis protein
MRDMMCDAMLEHELKKRGCMVWNRPFLKEDFASICIIKPDIVVLPEVRVEYSKLMAEQFKSWGGKVVIRMCEMGVTKKAIPLITDEYREAIYGHFDTNNIVDLVLAFGEPQKELYCKYSGVSENKVVAIGAMPFDPYSTKLPPNPPRKKPVIMFATGFSYADRNAQYALPEGKSGQMLHREKVNACRVNRAKWLHVIPALHSIYGCEYDFVIRPHAGERSPCYTELLGNYASLSKHTNGITALDYCDILVHAGSTMGIEAHITNKPGICMHPVSQDPVVTKLHPSGDTIDGFKKAMDSLTLGKSNANKRYANELLSYYAPVDGKSFVRAAEAISNIETSPTDIPHSWPEFKVPKFLDDPDIVTEAGTWFCAACKKSYYVTNMSREMVKCPYCGIANVRTATIPGKPK